MKKALLSLLVLAGLAAMPAAAQNNYIISTVAGTGTQGYNGDGIAATSAQLSSPGALCTDNTGNIYFTDGQNARIRKITTAGIISTVAGTGVAGFTGDGGAATAVRISVTTYGVGVDGSGNIYFVDGNRIRKVNASDGKINTVAGNGTGSSTGNGGAATAATVYQPGPIAFDVAGNVYFADAFGFRVRKITVSTGIISNVAGTGTTGFTGDNGDANSARVSNVYGLAFDASYANLYIADQVNGRVRKINMSTNIITTVAGSGSQSANTGDGGPATSAAIPYPHDVTVDASGNLYITSQYNAVVRKVDLSSGIISTVAGKEGVTGASGDGCAATSGLINFPDGIDRDASGNIYFVDAGNQRIRKLTPVANNVATAAFATTTYCAGTSLSVPFTTNGGTFLAGNTYTAQLSNASGSFNSPVTLGSISSTASSGSIPVTVPTNTATGSGYRIRVVSSNPCINGADNGTNLTLNATSADPNTFYISNATTSATNALALNTPLYYTDASCRGIATVSNTSSTALMGSTTAKVFVQSSAPSIATQPYVRRYFDIVPASNAATATADVTLFFTQADFTDYNTARGTYPALPIDAADAANNKANLRITQYHGTSASGTPGTYTGWAGAGAANLLITPTSVSWNANVSRWEVTFPVTGFSGFVASTVTAAPLPVKLLSFSADRRGADGLLTWAATNEVSADYYGIEHSTDGKTFSAIGKVATRNGEAKTRYSYTHTAPGTGTHYYRLKLTDRNGDFTYSETRILNIGKDAAGILLYPHPVTNVATVTGVEAGEQLRILGLDGRAVSTQTAEATTATVDMSGLPSGIYLLQVVKDGGVVSTARVTKQ